MKSKLLLFFVLFLMANVASFAQDTIAAWTFPLGTSADANPDYHNANNTTMLITTQGGTSVIDFTKNGLTTKAAQTTGWDGGANVKFWQIEINTTGYNNLKLYSKQTSGGSFAGPRDWKSQYRIGASGTWADIPGTTLVNANNWTSAVISNVNIPVAAYNQASVFIRWLMTTDTSSAAPALVASGGTTKIDDIYVLGANITAIDETLAVSQTVVYPNPGSGQFTITALSPGAEIMVFNLLGKQVYSSVALSENPTIDLGGFEKGVYFVRYKIVDSNAMHITKILIQ
ncbi:MAG: T9SS type A sorting domain-containing protein [Bacteroidota bacterium]